MATLTWVIIFDAAVVTPGTAKSKVRTSSSTTNISPSFAVVPVSMGTCKMFPAAARVRVSEKIVAYIHREVSIPFAFYKVTIYDHFE